MNTGAGGFGVSKKSGFTGRGDLSRGAGPAGGAAQRREPDPDKRLEGDDVTLLRVHLLPGQPSLLLACR
jgi:hypothetical protein